ncbi:hypothetical protein ANCCEY_13091 [Ancylostoma ceylanicum]|uniref:Peptidase A1 domain-containing protein n=1 Tax=Ancylostoma ceylanicum TaxID=53326 RepID=A0A0D6LJL9_9BILA|nr:hypothetical protein ANCCEY_13091 [Ancylostoma ceylanicum]
MRELELSLMTVYLERAEAVEKDSDVDNFEELEMLVIFALLTLLGCTQPAQHKMQLRKITPEMVKMLRKGTWAKYVDEVHKQQQHAHQMDSDGKYEYDVIGYSDIEYIGEVTIGTPEQRFLVLIDTGTTYLWVPDKSCYKQTNRPSECQSSLCDPGCEFMIDSLRFEVPVKKKIILHDRQRITACSFCFKIVTS